MKTRGVSLLSQRHLHSAFLSSIVEPDSDVVSGDAEHLEDGQDYLQTVSIMFLKLQCRMSSQQTDKTPDSSREKRE